MFNGVCLRSVENGVNERTRETHSTDHNVVARMCYTGFMVDEESGSDVPPHLIYLAKQLARECVTPGTYDIRLTVPAHSSTAFAIEIGRYERVRRSSFGRQREKGVR